MWLVGIDDQFEGFGIYRTDCAFDVFAGLAQIEPVYQPAAQSIQMKEGWGDT